MKTVKHQANMGAIKSVKPFSQEFKKKRFEVSFVVVLNVRKRELQIGRQICVGLSKAPK